ncbi:MAG: OmpA family protein [Trichlorobacter sp.]|nr:OmpA family protein [Trichlorobacter sp.]
MTSKTTKALIGTCLICTALATQAHASSKLHAWFYRYDYSTTAVTSHTADNQHVICNTCPKVAKLEPAPPVAAGRTVSDESVPLVPYIPRQTQASQQKMAATGTQDLDTTQAPKTANSTASISLVNNQTPIAQSEGNTYTAYFGYDQATLKRHDAQTLATMLRENNQGQPVQISGHASHEGSRLYNKALSRNRAEHAARIANEQGVNIQSVTGYGYDKPTGQGSQYDRRVEIKEVRQ